MKSKFFFVMSVAATMLLTSCGGNTPTSSEATSQGGTTSEQGTTSQQQEAKVVSVTCDPTASVEVGKKVTLNPTVTVEGGASKVCLFASSDKAIATVNDAGVVTGVAEGEATITITAKADSTKKCEVKVTVIGEQIAKIKDLEEGKTYTVKGQVVATNTKSFIIHDGTAAIMVYQNKAPEVAIGDMVKVEGAVASSTYSAGLLQFDSKATVTADQGQINVPVAVDLTAEIADGWKTTQAAAGTKTQYYSQVDMKLYKWETTVAKDGDYSIIKVAGSDVVIEPVYMDASEFTLEEGKKYNVEGYFAGYRVPSSGNGYAQIVITKAEEKAKEQGEVTISGPKEVTVGQEIELSATIEGILDGAVTWSLKEDSMKDFATLTPENGNKVKVTGVAVGKVTVVATYETHSAEYAVTIKSVAVEKKLNAVALNDIAILDVVVVAEGFNGYVVADDTQAAFVYDKTNKPVVGTHLSLTAKVAQYNGGLQLAPEKDGYVVAEGAAPTAIAPVAMTEELGLSALEATKAAKTNSTLPDLTKVGLFTFENVLIGGSGNYLTWDVGSAHFETNNTADANKPVAGKNYDITGLVYGYYNDTAKKVEYATVVVTSCAEHAAAEGSIVVSGDKEVKVGESITLTASVVGNDTAVVNCNTTDSDKVTVTPDNANGFTVTGVAEGEATLHFVCGEATLDYKVTVKPAPVAPTKEHGTAENPISVASAKDLCDDLTVPEAGESNYDENMLFVEGVITKITYAWKGTGSMSFELKDANGLDSDAIACQFIYLADDFKVAPVVGETVLLRGYACIYKKNAETAEVLQISAPKNATAETRATVLNVVGDRASVDITLGDHANATVTGLPETAKLESTVSFTVEVDSGYKIDAVKVNGVAANAVEGVYSFMVEKETTVVVETSEEGAVVTEYSAAIAAGTNAEACLVNGINGMKVATGKKAGDCTVTVGAGATKLTFYAAAWYNGTGTTVELTGASAGTTSFTLTPDTGITNASPFTLTGEVENYKFETTLSDIEEETVITLSSSKRFVIWDATYSIA